MLAALVISASVSRVWTAPVLACQLTSTAVNESSGISASPTYPGVFYTHNDSGDSARIFRFRLDGSSSVVTVSGATAIDWEDMAVRRNGGVSHVYVADVGDNLQVRPTVRVYRFPEPPLGATSVPAHDTYTLSYPDGRKNCEALIVDPSSGDLYLVTKDATQAGVYRLQAPSQSGSYTLTRLGTLFPNTGGGDAGKLVTGGAVSPDGRYVSIRTYTGVLEFKVAGAFADWWRQTPLAVAMPTTSQGESVCYDARGGNLYSSSEGTPCPIYRQRLIASLPHR